MTALKTPRHVPQLRFPKFRKAGAWEIKPISKLAQLAKGVQLNRAAITGGEFPVWNGGVTPSGFHNEWNTEGETITISEGGNSCGFVNRGNQRFWLGGHCYALENLSSEVDGDFLFQSLKSKQAEIMRLRVGSGLPNIQRHDLERFPVVFPHPSEQQKIAECLGNLDDLIAAEGRKLEALWQHKRGLMQQLFPPPGETVPWLRFPEFRCCPDPEARELGDVCAIVNGGTPKSTVAEYWGGDVQWLTPKDMGQMDGREICLTPRTISQSGLDRSSTELVPERSVIVSTRAPIGHLAINTTPMAFNQGCRGLVPGDEIGYLFLYYFLAASRDRLKKLGAGGTFKELSVSSLKTVTITLPVLEEQRRIADCLGSLDDLIEAEDWKIGALRLHKQGLMQQLFPSLDTE